MRLPFFLEAEERLKRGFVLSANPQLYDYFHFLVLKQKGELEMHDGAGQVINVDAHGKYRIHVIDGNTAEMDFDEIIESAPHGPHRGEKIRDVDPLHVKVTREEGIFPFREEPAWDEKDEEEWPCLLYRTRYIFDVDPLVFARASQERNLYYRRAKYDLIDSARYYYWLGDRKQLTAKEMVKLGIPRESFWETHPPWNRPAGG